MTIAKSLHRLVDSVFGPSTAAQEIQALEARISEMQQQLMGFHVFLAATLAELVRDRPEEGRAAWFEASKRRYVDCAAASVFCDVPDPEVQGEIRAAIIRQIEIIVGAISIDPAGAGGA